MQPFTYRYRLGGYPHFNPPHPILHTLLFFFLATLPICYGLPTGKAGWGGSQLKVRSGRQGVDLGTYRSSSLTTQLSTRALGERQSSHRR